MLSAEAPIERPPKPILSTNASQRIFVAPETKIMAHNRKLVIGGVALIKACLKNTGPAMVGVCDELEKVLTASEFFANAPFRWISLIIRYGLKNEFAPVYQRINKTHGDLPISVEVDRAVQVLFWLVPLVDYFRRAFWLET